MPISIHLSDEERFNLSREERYRKVRELLHAAATIDVSFPDWEEEQQKIHDAAEALYDVWSTWADSLDKDVEERLLQVFEDLCALYENDEPPITRPEEAIKQVIDNQVPEARISVKEELDRWA